jgi:hypothetical protein
VPKSLDTAESLVVSATLVCRIHHDAGKIMIKFDEHLTSLGGSIVMFHIPILDMLVPVRDSSFQQTLACTEERVFPTILSIDDRSLQSIGRKAGQHNH